MLSGFPELPGRAGGILLHPSSLPGPYGIGDLGPAAMVWLEWLSRAGCNIWQCLPLGPTGYADSPYQSFSTFAGNHLLISPDRLVEQELLSVDEVSHHPEFSMAQVDFATVISWKEALLDRVAASFPQRASPGLTSRFALFCKAQAHWLEDYAHFMAIKQSLNGLPWTTWPPQQRERASSGFYSNEPSLAEAIEAQKIRQFLFDDQWHAVHKAARQLGITIVGDIPIFVAHDSADVWSHPELFKLAVDGQPAFVAGVPPDYFSATGQRWGNPLYDWDRMAEGNFKWWVNRLERALQLVDVVRLDHFRGLCAHWEIPAIEQTAENGRWVSGPGELLLNALRDAFGGLPMIAEDLGVITQDVINLRQAYRLPGMKVMQFGFEGGPEDDFLPHRYEELTVAYTGTHDNDTSLGWYAAASPEIQDACRRYLNSDGNRIAWDMVTALWASQAAWAIAPLQDLLELGSEARMNFPGTVHGNWAWRVHEGQLSGDLADRLRTVNVQNERSRVPA